MREGRRSRREAGRKGGHLLSEKTFFLKDRKIVAYLYVNGNDPIESKINHLEGRKGRRQEGNLLGSVTEKTSWSQKPQGCLPDSAQLLAALFPGRLCPRLESSSARHS